MFSCIYKHWKTLPCYCPVLFFFNLDTPIQNCPSSSYLNFALLVNCLCHKHIFPHPLYLLHISETKFKFIDPTCCTWSSDFFLFEPCQRIQVGWMSMKEAGFVVIGWYMLYFRLLSFVISEKYGESEMSSVVILVSVSSFFCLLIVYLLFSL